MASILTLTIDVLLVSAASSRRVCIHSDNRVTIPALSSLTVRLKTSQVVHDLISNNIIRLEASRYSTVLLRLSAGPMYLP